MHRLQRLLLALTPLRHSAVELLRWWTGELSAIWNDRPWARRRTESAQITVHWPPSPTDAQSSGDAPRSNWDAVTAASPLRVVLAADQTLTLTTRFPRLPKRELDAAIALWLERQLPVPLSDVRVASTAMPLPEVPGQCLVTVRVVRSHDIAAITEAARHANAELTEIAVSDAATATITPILQFAGRSTGRPSTRLDQALLAGGVLSFLAVASFAAWQEWQASQAFDALQRTQRPATEAVTRDLREIATREPPLKTLRNRMARPTAGEVLSSLTAVLPEDTWVVQLSIESSPGQTALVRGTVLTFSARQIDGLLRDTAYLDDPRIENTTVFDTRNQQMRVEFSAVLAETASGDNGNAATSGPRT